MKEGWEYKKLGDITTTINGLWTGKKPPFVTVAVVRNTNFTKDCKLDMSNVAYLDVEEKQYVTRKLKSGDIIIEKSGGSDKQPVGRPVLFEISDGEYSFSNFTSTLRINDLEQLSPKFLHYSLYGAYLRGDTLKMQSKTTGIHNLDFKAYKNLLVPTPSIAEQKLTVEELDLLSSIIEKKKAQLKELDNLAQSLFYEMFGHLYETAFPIKVLIDICEFIKDGTHQTPTYTDDKVNGVKFLSAKDVVSGYINWENVKLIPFELHQELHKRIAPQRNDLLLCKNGTTGICAIVETDEIFDIYVSLALLRPKKPFCPKYLLYAINNPQTKRQFDESLKGIGVPNLHLGEIKKTKIIFPPLELQQQFATKIEAIEHQKEHIKQSIKEVETLFSSRMDYYFI